jgi:hypothetical protein
VCMYVCACVAIWGGLMQMCVGERLKREVLIVEDIVENCGCARHLHT